MDTYRQAGRFLNELGDLSRFTARFFSELFKRRPEVEEFFRQCFWVGYKSLPLVGITAFIMAWYLPSNRGPRW